jgi:hypothetical protein
MIRRKDLAEHLCLPVVAAAAITLILEENVTLKCHQMSFQAEIESINSDFLCLKRENEVLASQLNETRKSLQLTLSITSVQVRIA